MKITQDTSLQNFEFWGGAEDLAKSLSGSELDRVEQILEEQYPEGMDATDLNDFFAYEGDTVAEWLGYKSEEYILMRDDAKYLLEEAKNMLEEVREDNFTPEFTLGDEAVIKFREDHDEMSEEAFIEEGWKQYLAEVEWEGEKAVSEIEDEIEDYEDTLDYLRLELLDYEIGFAIAALKKGETTLPSGESFMHFRDRLTDKIEDVKDIMYGQEARDFADILIDDLNNCSGLLMDEKEAEEPDR